MFENKVGGYPVDWFVSPIGSFICGICSKVLKNPHQCRKGHLFCLSCVEFKFITQCPTCKISIHGDLFSRSSFAENQIMALTVKCDCLDVNSVVNRGMACSWTGTLEERLTRISHSKLLAAMGLILQTEVSILPPPLPTPKLVSCTECGDLIEANKLDAHHIYDCSFAFEFNLKQRTVLQLEEDKREMASQTVKSMTSANSEHTSKHPQSQYKPRNKHTDGHHITKYSNGDIHDGCWLNGKQHGPGVKTYSNGDRFSGEWIDDRKHGAGTMYYANGVTVECVWTNGIMSDTVTITRVDGIYTGQVHKQHRHGQGEMRYFSGHIYEGQWECDRKHGTGVMLYAHKLSTELNGAYYSGEWRQNMKCGQGTEVDTQGGGTYSGGFENGVRQGQGTLRLPDGCFYCGQWKEGVKCGVGRESSPTGEVFRGTFERGVKHGQGTCTLSDGKVVEEVWTNGVLVK